ncbi:nuclease-related domain-containing protein [Nocardioides cynanchi]|uniref:nuclease-related domain-containing protein n=1 Tax=Nocardioides cynanchi TaxID=2558918 RepID=UPI00192D8D5F|nr:nuclease-related domain-containing protein [Nocardioides cynanchi]
MDEISGIDQRKMRLRYAGTCSVCGAALPAKVEALYERSTKTVSCLAHDDPDETTVDVADAVDVAEVVDAGTPGASARREFERRKANREKRIRSSHPRLGGLIHALSDEPQSTTAWDTGALGEERLGRRLSELAGDTFLVLHDRRIPGTRANIDHLAVTGTGVYVIDAKKYRGRPQLRVEGGILRPRTERVLVGSRDCTELVDGVLHQVDVVRRFLTEDVPLHGVLCFVEADWPLFGGGFTSRGVEALWPQRLYPKLTAPGPLHGDTLADLHRRLAVALPPA